MAEQQRYQWMFTNTIVDEQFIVEQSDIPNKDELVTRMKPVWESDLVCPQTLVATTR